MNCMKNVSIFIKHQNTTWHGKKYTTRHEKNTNTTRIHELPSLGRSMPRGTLAFGQELGHAGLRVFGLFGYVTGIWALVGLVSLEVWRQAYRFEWNGLGL